MTSLAQRRKPLQIRFWNNHRDYTVHRTLNATPFWTFWPKLSVCYNATVHRSRCTVIRTFDFSARTHAQKEYSETGRFYFARFLSVRRVQFILITSHASLQLSVNVWALIPTLALLWHCVGYGCRSTTGKPAIFATSSGTSRKAPNVAYEYWLFFCWSYRDVSFNCFLFFFFVSATSSMYSWARFDFRWS